MCLSVPPTPPLPIVRCPTHPFFPLCHRTVQFSHGYLPTSTWFSFMLFLLLFSQTKLVSSLLTLSMPLQTEFFSSLRPDTYQLQLNCSFLKTQSTFLHISSHSIPLWTILVTFSLIFLISNQHYTYRLCNRCVATSSSPSLQQIIPCLSSFFTLNKFSISIFASANIKYLINLTSSFTCLHILCSYHLIF